MWQERVVMVSKWIHSQTQDIHLDDHVIMWHLFCCRRIVRENGLNRWIRWVSNSVTLYFRVNKKHRIIFHWSCLQLENRKLTWENFPKQLRRILSTFRKKRKGESWRNVKCCIDSVWSMDTRMDYITFARIRLMMISSQPNESLEREEKSVCDSKSRRQTATAVNCSLSIHLGCVGVDLLVLLFLYVFSSIITDSIFQKRPMYGPQYISMSNEIERSIEAIANRNFRLFQRFAAALISIIDLFLFSIFIGEGVDIIRDTMSCMSVSSWCDHPVCLPCSHIMCRCSIIS